MKRILQTSDNVLLLVIRLAVGLIIFPHGAQKLLGWFGGPGYAGMMEVFTANMGIPTILAVLAIVAEFFGALGLIFGFLGRLAALGVAADMVGAIILVNWANGFFWTSGGYEFPLLIGVLALVIVIGGSGPISLDRLLAGRPK